MSNPSVLHHLAGRHFGSVVVTPLVANASTGVLSATGTTADILTFSSRLVVSVEPTLTASKSEAMGLGSTIRNEIIEDDAAGLTLTVNRTNLAGGTSPLERLFLAYDYFQVAWTEGVGSGVLTTKTFIGLRGEYSSTGAGRGVQTETVTFGPVDTGAVAPYRRS